MDGAGPDVDSTSPCRTLFGKQSGSTGPCSSGARLRHTLTMDLRLSVYTCDMAEKRDSTATDVGGAVRKMR